MFRKGLLDRFKTNNKVHQDIRTSSKRYSEYGEQNNDIDNLDNSTYEDDDADDLDDDYNESELNDDSCIYYVKHKTADIIQYCNQSITIGKCKTFFNWFMDYAYFEFRISYDDLMLMLTFFILLAPSIAYLTIPASGEEAFNIAMIVCLSIFVTEFCISTFSRTEFIQKRQTMKLYDDGHHITVCNFTILSWKGYFFSPVWFLDIIIICSLFPEIPIIATALNLPKIGSVILAARFIRMVRVLRAVKLVYLLHQRRAHDKQKAILHEQLLQTADNTTNIVEELAKLDKKILPSKLGEQLSNAIITKVVTLIVVIMLVLPFITSHSKNNVVAYSADTLQDINQQTGLSDAVKMAMVQSIIHKLNLLHIPSVYLQMLPFQSNAIVNNRQAFEDLRNIAIVSLTNHDYDTITHINYSTVADYSIDYYLRLQAQYSLGLIVVVCSVAIIAIYTFTQDITRLVLKPIARMMKVVQVVAKNPLAHLEFYNNLGGHENNNNNGGNNTNTDGSNGNSYGHGNMDTFETDLLESTFIKIAGLLRVCFGEAGAGIIKANLAIHDNNNKSIINPLLPGVRVYCIVGFCDIHRFDFVLRRLGKDVLLFVNTVAAIVHENVHSWEGVCNKNLGNAFVLIWRIGDETTLKSYTIKGKLQRKVSQVTVSVHSDHDHQNKRDSSRRSTMHTRKYSASTKSIKQTEHNNHNNSRNNSSINQSMNQSTNSIHNCLSSKPSVCNHDKFFKFNLKSLPGVDQLAAKALIAFIKINAELRVNDDIFRYHLDSTLQVDSNVSFNLNMGFGLHAGWAIEGAVGSLQKVDATYLSPHVNIAARLETASRQYGVPLLVSQDFYELLSPYVQSLMRRLDVVTVKGSVNPIGIYTYDLLPIHHTGSCKSNRASKIQNRNRHSTLHKDELKRSSISKRDDLESFKVSSPVPMMRKVLRFSSAVSAISVISTPHPLAHPSRSDSDMLASTTTTTAAAAGGAGGTLTPKLSYHKGRVGTSKSEKRYHPMTSSDEPDDVFEKDRDVVYLRSHITESFLNEFSNGMSKYISGDWLEAKIIFENCDNMSKYNAALDNCHGDSPSQTLLKYMKSFQFQAPKSWRGYRCLISK